MLFASREHQAFYENKVDKLKPDCYLRALIYTLGICKDTRRNWEGLYSESNRSINPEVITHGWQTDESLKVTRLAFQLFTDTTPTATDQDALRECRQYSVSEIFCSQFAPYYVEAIKIRYPEYFQRQ